MSSFSQASRRIQIFSMVGLSATMMCAAAPFTAPPPLNIAAPATGLSAHFKKPNDDQFSMIRRAGFTWLRLDLAWSDTEKKKGVYDFSSFDKLADSLKTYGLSAVVILAYGNPLYVHPDDPPGVRNRADTDEFREAFARWAATAVKRYAGYNFVWELWNEPNSEKFWPPKKNVREYVELMTNACAAIHAQTPSARLIGPATTGVDIPFIRGCLKGGMLKYWSAISVHPYRDSPPETVRQSYRVLRAEIAKYTDDGQPVPIVCSEWGYPSDGSDAAKARQAEYLAGVIKTNYEENIPLTFWYTWTPHFDDPGDWKFALAFRSDRRDPRSPLEFAPALQRAHEVLNHDLSKP